MKKVLKRTLAVITALSLSVACGISAFAAKFPDVTDETYPWAVEAVEAMADDGIIKGYEDGTFNPAKTVSKIESLVLISRILGYENELSRRLIDTGWEIYGEDIAEYELPYGEKEIAYLLAKGVITGDEIEEYVSADNRDDGLKRYEVAKLLTRALDAEKKIGSELISKLSYADNGDIPANSKKYVAYVTDQGLMQGMDGNKFAPNETVTRAQAAVVLYKLQEMTDYKYKTGIVSSIDQTTRLIKIKESETSTLSSYITTDIIIRYNGNVIGINDISVGYEAVLTYKNGKLYAIDFTDALIDDVVYGSYIGSSSSTAKGLTVNVYVIADNDTELVTDKKTTYKLSSDCVITYNDTTCALSSLKSGAYLKLTLKKGIVTMIEAQDKSGKITGRVDEVILEPVYKLRIEENGGNMAEYLVTSDVQVTRNGKKVSAREVLAGDSLTATLSYGRIKSITATSKSSAKNGVIKEVIISASPRITLTIDGVDTTYYVTGDAEITLSGEKGTFYDLRVGTVASVKLDSDTVVSIETVLSDDVLTWAGTVTLVNSSYGLLQIEFFDQATSQTRTESVFVKSNASIVDYETQKSKKVSDIKVGMKVNVTGSMQTGVFEAGTVIIIG